MTSLRREAKRRAMPTVDRGRCAAARSFRLRNALPRAMFGRANAGLCQGRNQQNCTPPALERHLVRSVRFRFAVFVAHHLQRRGPFLARQTSPLSPAPAWKLTSFLQIDRLVPCCASATVRMACVRVSAHCAKSAPTETVSISRAGHLQCCGLDRGRRADDRRAQLFVRMAATRHCYLAVPG